VTVERWRQIKTVFEEAVERAGAERDRFLAEACSSDRDLCQQVEALLVAEARASEHLSSLVQVEAEQLSSETSELVIGRRISVYRITSALGRGGMGSVYLAVRADDVYEPP
jgi:eukaryotic-like serine/threonine-protein kinase